MKIKVEEKHCRDGFRGNCRFCPVAMAIWEQFPDFYVSVDILYKTNTISVMFNENEIKFVNPELAFAIRNYDKTGIMAPTEFEFPYEKAKTKA